ncbi:MAG: hypothetical protein AB7O52_11790 [Planctomycetota bacterium]
MRLRMLLALLLLAIAIPIVVVEYTFEPVPPTPTDEVTKPRRLESPSIVPTVESPPPVRTATEPEASPSLDALPGAADHSAAKAALEFCGTLRSSARRELGGHELSLRGVSGERPVWTTSLGEFAFSASPTELPLRLVHGQGQTLFRLDVPPGHRRVLVNPSLLEVLPPSGPSVDLILARAVVFERGVGSESCRVRVFGSTRLPPATDLVVRLLGGGDHIVQETLFSYAGDDVIGEIEFPFGQLYSGWYKIQLAWRVYSAAPEVLARFREGLPDPLPGELPPKMHLAVYVGDPDSERVQEDAIRVFYEAALAECKASRDLVQWVAASARGKPPRLSLSRVEATRKHALFASARPLAARNLDLRKWRRFVDVELPNLWKPYRDPAAVPFPAKYPDRKQYLLHAYVQLAKLAHLESRLLYRALGKAPDPNDYVDFDFGVETEHALTEQRLAEFLDALAKDMQGQ